jgi:hypothetical protein
MNVFYVSEQTIASAATHMLRFIGRACEPRVDTTVRRHARLLEQVAYSYSACVNCCFPPFAVCTGYRLHRACQSRTERSRPSSSCRVAVVQIYNMWRRLFAVYILMNSDASRFHAHHLY